MQSRPSTARRRVLVYVAALGAGRLLPVHGEDRRTLRVGYQKASGLLGLLKAQRALEGKLSSLGWNVSWAEFPAGPQLLEAMNAGSLDFGYVGAPPPIFAQAAGQDLLYVGAEPIGLSTEAIVVKRSAAAARASDLKGLRVAVQKGSTAHYLLIEALTSYGLTLKDIEPVYLPPAYARAAFEANRVDAWSIWDPYLANAESSMPLRVLVDNTLLPTTFGFYMAPRSFAEHSTAVLTVVLAELSAVGSWAGAHPEEAAAAMAPQVALPLGDVEVWQRRARYGERSIDKTVIDRQQTIADAFYAHGLIPERVDVSRAAWSPRTR